MVKVSSTYKQGPRIHTSKHIRSRDLSINHYLLPFTKHARGRGFYLNVTSRHAIYDLWKIRCYGYKLYISRFHYIMLIGHFLLNDYQGPI